MRIKFACKKCGSTDMVYISTTTCEEDILEWWCCRDCRTVNWY